MSLGVEFPPDNDNVASDEELPTRNARRHYSYRATILVGDTYFVNINVRVAFVPWGIKLAGKVTQLQGSAKRLRPGFVNAAGKIRQKR